MSEILTPEQRALYEASATEVMAMGRFAIKYAQVERVPRYESGRSENDAEHSLMLGLIAVQLANQFYPKLDRGVISQSAMIHDAPEIYTGDVPTFGISETDRAVKEAAERLAAERLYNELPEPWCEILRTYEEQKLPEVRLVRLVDKMCPAITNCYGQGRLVMSEAYGVNSLEQLKAKGTSDDRLAKMFPEFPHLLNVRKIIVDRMKRTMYPESY